MKPVIPVFFATDNNYAPFVAVTLESILENCSKDYFYHFHVLTTDLDRDVRHCKRREQIYAIESKNFVA